MTDKITKFRPQTKNVNKHTAYGLRLLEKSLREDGFIDAQTAAADGEIISGSARLEKAVEIFTDENGVEVEPIIVHSDGTRPVIVIRDDIPNAESARAKRLSVAANKIAQVDFDPDWGLLKDWGAEDAGIKALFSDKEWQEGTGEEKKGGDAEPQIDRAAELQEKWQTESGQLWQLGNHRLLIGDCTVRENVERLMGGERASMVFIDPPYGMEYKGREFGKNGIQNDGEEFQEVLRKANELFPIESGVIAVWFGTSRQDKMFQAMSGRNYHRALFMYKPNGLAYTWHGWILTSEVMHLFSCGKPEWIAERHHHDVYTFDYSERPERDVDHPTVKPLSICEDIMSKVKAEIIYDCFAGSGTTIIAAQNLYRRCYAMEISEKYGAVILERFATAFPSLEIKRLE